MLHCTALVPLARQTFENYQPTAAAAASDSNAPSFEERPQRFRYRSITAEEMQLIEVSIPMYHV
jgi:hypothetical protein